MPPTKNQQPPLQLPPKPRASSTPQNTTQNRYKLTINSNGNDKSPPTANQPPQTTTTITGSATNFKSKNLNKRGGKNQNLQQTLLAYYSHKHRQPKTQPTTAITTTPPPAYNPNPTDRSMTQNSHIKTHPKSHTHDLIKRSEGRRQGLWRLTTR